jgi:hypothetical protein
MIWAIYGILHSLLRAALTETNRVYQLDAIKLSFGQALFGVVLLLPFLPMMEWPSDPHFYRCAIGVATIFSIGMLANLTLAANRAGRVASIYMPFEAIGATLIWLAVMPQMRDAYEADMLTTYSIVIAYVISTGALVMVRRNDINFRTFLLVAPVGISYAVAGTVTKAVMPFSPVFPAALSFALIGFLVMAVVMGVTALISGHLDRQLFSARGLGASFATGLVSACSYVAFVTSVTLAPNPGYTSLIAFLLPVWLWAWHLVIGVEDQANPMAAIFIVIGVAMLITAAW